MRTKEFLSQLDHDRIVSAIKTAEATTSGQIRVFVQRGDLTGDPVIAAQEKFRKLGMEATQERNGVLIFVLPRARKFAVVGDEGVHAKCGAEFRWEPSNPREKGSPLAARLSLSAKDIEVLRSSLVAMFKALTVLG